MDKRELQRWLDKSGMNLARLCDDLGLARSTATRWRPEVPPYAAAYAVALAHLPPDQREQVRGIVQTAHGSVS